MDDSGVLEALASYVPAQLIRHLLANPVPARKPSDVHFQSAVLYVDIGGLDALLAHLLPEGADGLRRLTQVLNAYFNLLVDFVKIEGGDIMNLAGDRVLVLWPAEHEDSRRASVADLVAATRRATQCALSLQKMLHDYDAGDQVRLTMRMTIAAGKVFTASVGGALGRWEFLTSGETVGQAARMIHDAAWGDILLSPQAYALIRTQCVGQELPSGDFRLENIRFPLPARTSPPPVLEPEMTAPLRAYVPGAILNGMTTGQTGWLAELRTLTVLCINVSGVTHDVTLEQMHAAMRTMQRALYRYSGSVNKLYMGDSGMILMAAMGLPPLSHPDDASRAVQVALLIAKDLQDQAQALKIGISTGQAFCVSVGSARRREYTMIGEPVARARELMGSALQVSDQVGEGGVPEILCDEATYQAAQTAVAFGEHTLAGDTASCVYVPQRSQVS